MQTNQTQPSRVRRTINDLVLAEMFLVQATIESATAIGQGLGAIGREMTDGSESGTNPWDSISSVVRRTADEAVEPYASRFRYLRELVISDK